MPLEVLFSIVVIILIGVATGYVIQKLDQSMTRRAILVFVTVLPLVFPAIWLGVNGCFEESQSPDRDCYGWDYILSMLAIFVMPPWFAAIGVGYLKPWEKYFQNQR